MKTRNCCSKQRTEKNKKGQKDKEDEKELWGRLKELNASFTKIKCVLQHFRTAP